jgi:hypothetical protein
LLPSLQSPGLQLLGSREFTSDKSNPFRLALHREVTARQESLSPFSVHTSLWSMVIEELIVGQQGIDERKRLGNLG